jgi:3-mercaptopyruvate sulfurtransferase SseA
LRLISIIQKDKMMENRHSSIGTEELFEKSSIGQLMVIDTRASHRYNGWVSDENSRGGHISGAVSLPFKWTRYMDWLDIVRSKGLLPGNPLAIYGDHRDEIDEVSEMFERAGYEKIYRYYDFEVEWLPDEKYPLDHLSRFSHLVFPGWIKDLQEGKQVPHYNKDKFKIVHAHYRNREAYLSGHIPGAIDMDTLAVESPETWNRRSPEELKASFEAHGITHDTTVILYGKYMNPDNADAFPGSAAGHIGAIRIAFIMLYAGVADVRILDGGFQSWKDAGYEIEYEDIPKVPVKDFGLSIPQRPELAVDVPEAKEMLDAEDAALVCVRSWPEYLGEVSGYNYIEKKGRIPGAIFGNCGSDAYHMENYRNPDHSIREFREVERIWKESGIQPDKHLAFYCGTGWRGSEAFFNAWLMGWPRVSVFDGGWFEWSNDPSNPYEIGEPA